MKKTAFFVAAIVIVVALGLWAQTNIQGGATNNGTPQNPFLEALVALATGANPSQATAGNQIYGAGDQTGNAFVRQDGPNPFTCTVTLSTNTTTQCKAAPAAGLKAYVTDFQLNTTTAGTATTVTLTYGTGSNCGTGTTALTAINYPNTTTGITNVLGVRTPLLPAAANAVCATQAGTTPGTTVVEIRGFTAP